MQVERRGGEGGDRPADGNATGRSDRHVAEVEHEGRHDQPQTDAFSAPVPIAPNAAIELRVEVDYERLRFGFRAGDEGWTWIPQQFDASILSDEATAPGLPNFTGAFVGVACQDMSGSRCPADFDWFEYVERPYRVDPFAS